MNLVINHSLDEPIYQQIYRQMVQMIAEGYLQEDEELPSVRELAREAGINPMTVQKAYALLEKNNLISMLGPQIGFRATSCLAMMMRCISLVPSPMHISMASRWKRSISYSIE